MDTEILFILAFIVAIIIIGLAMIYLFMIGSKDDQKRAPEQASTSTQRVKNTVLGGALLAVPVVLVLLTIFLRRFF